MWELEPLQRHGVRAQTSLRLCVVALAVGAFLTGVEFGAQWPVFRRNTRVTFSLHLIIVFYSLVNFPPHIIIFFLLIDNSVVLLLINNLLFFFCQAQVGQFRHLFAAVADALLFCDVKSRQVTTPALPLNQPPPTRTRTTFLFLNRPAICGIFADAAQAASFFYLDVF